MPPTSRGQLGRARARRTATLLSIALSAGLLASAVPALAHPAATANGTPVELPVRDAYRPGADLGFADLDRTGAVRVQRNDLTGALAGRVDLIQATSSSPVGNKAAERPMAVAERATLLSFIPAQATTRVSVRVSVDGTVMGTLTMNHPRRIPASDQTYDSRGSVAWSTQAWSVELPWQWVRPDLTLTFTDGDGRSGSTPVELAAPVEMVINNIQLGMLTTAPDSGGHRFIRQPANGATDYFQTIPIAQMTMARYEKVELDKVIVRTGAIYDTASAGEGGVYSGDMRENVGKAQVSTGINLATWGITSSDMNQNQPQVTNQRVIHHSAGMYANGYQSHGLSGGNGMATLYDSFGNELSHELGHSYGLGHFPGKDNSKTGDDRIRNASHHMDSGWGWIAYRKLMRSNLNPGAYEPVRKIDEVPFTESLAGKYNFNTDTMAGGWDASPVADYTHMTAYSLRRTQDHMRTVTADTAYPSGYRDWDATAGEWVDAKVTNPGFNRPRPARVGGSVFTLLGGYNPANPAQSLLYPAFRSNYGVTFDLPQVDPTAVTQTRRCWVQITFTSLPTRYVEIGAGDGVKQLNINIAESDEPTGAQIACRKDGITTTLGEPITIATDLAPMAAPVVVGRTAGFEALRTVELTGLEARLASLADQAYPALTTNELRILRGWSDDLSALSPAAREVAERALHLADDAADLKAWVAEHGDALGDDDPSGASATLMAFLQGHGYLDGPGRVLPVGNTVTVDGGKCLTLDQEADGSTLVRATTSKTLCTGSSAETWWVDSAGRIHPADRPELCLRAQTPVVTAPCSDAMEQRWLLQDDGHVVRASAPGTALDLFRSNHRPGLYGHSAGGNQIWTGFVTSPHTLLGALDAAGLSALWSAWRPMVGVDTSVAPGESGWITSPSHASARAHDPFTSTPLAGEISLGGAWTPAPVALGQGESVVRVRATNSRGATSTTVRTVRVDTVAPATVLTDDHGARLTATDATSGVQRIEWRDGSGAWQTYTAPVTGLTGSLSFRALDVAGNVEASHVVPLAELPPGAVTPPGGSSPLPQTKRLRTRTTLVAPATVAPNARFVAKVKVRTASGAKVPGRVKVKVHLGKRKVLTRVATLRKGKIWVAIPGLKTPGRHTITVVYVGDTTRARSRAKRVVRVTR